MRSTVAEAPNVPPEAEFDSTSEDLTLSVDASASTDSDGSIASYDWDFGDGTTDTGVTAEHTYASAGSYLVRLTVTDDDGATDQATAAVTVPTGGAPLALDEFNRTLSSGLGTADVGGSWNTSGASGFAVADGDGVYKLTSAGISRTAYLGGVATTTSDLRMSFTTDKPVTGGGIYATVLGRRISTTDDYRLNLRLLNTNKVTASLGALKGSSTATSLSSTVTLPGNYAPGTDVHVRFQVTGTNDTTVRAKVWLGSDPEPENVDAHCCRLLREPPGPGIAGSDRLPVGVGDERAGQPPPASTGGNALIPAPTGHGRRSPQGCGTPRGCPVTAVDPRVVPGSPLTMMTARPVRYPADIAASADSPLPAYLVNATGPFGEPGRCPAEFPAQRAGMEPSNATRSTSTEWSTVIRTRSRDLRGMT